MNLSLSLSRVCPTYCFLHFVQVMAYIRFELLHEMLHIVANFSVMMFLILPLLSRRGQYLQLFLLQKLKPLCLFLAKSGVWGLPVKLPSELDGLTWAHLGVAVLLAAILKKSVMDVCLLMPVVPVGLGLSSATGTRGLYLGSASSSPLRKGTFALVRRSLKFLGLMYPHTSFLLYKKSVVLFLPRIGQF